MVMVGACRRVRMVVVVVGARRRSLTGAGPSLEVVVVADPGRHSLTVVLSPRCCRWWWLWPLVDGGGGCSSLFVGGGAFDAVR